MDQFFMNLYRTRLYLPLVIGIFAYVFFPGVRKKLARAGQRVNYWNTRQAAALCAGISFALCLGVIYQGKSWGGDFSQYFAQARAIASGTIPQWYEKNIFIIDHSCVIGADVYPWMWPLMIAPFYAMFHSFPIMLLKVYESVFVAAGVVLLVYFLHRRVSLSKAVFLSSFISCNFVYIMDVNSVEADLISFFWGMVALNFIDLYLRERKRWFQRIREGQSQNSSRIRAGKLRRLIFYSIFSGVGIYVAVMTKTLCEGLLLALLAYDLVCMGSLMVHGYVKSRSRRDSLSLGEKTLPNSGGYVTVFLCGLLPYIAYTVCTKLANLFLLPSGGSYRDYFTFTSWRFQNGIHWYYGIFQSFFGSGVRPIIAAIVWICGTLLLVLTVIGIVLKCKEELFYGFYVCGMILMLLFYDYYRSSFVLTFFPLMILFSYYSLSWMIGKIRVSFGVHSIRAICYAVLALVIAQSLTAVYAVRGKGYNMNDIMTVDTQETFDYIRQNLDSEDIVYFLKPRVLYFYTDVYAYYWDDDDPERLDLADYVLMSVYNKQPRIQQELDTSGEYAVEFQNKKFTLYRRK